MARFLKEWLGDAKNRAMTRLANRTFKNDPNVLDKLARRILASQLPPVTDDPELAHPTDS